MRKKEISPCSSDNCSSWHGCGKNILMAKKKVMRVQKVVLLNLLQTVDTRNQSHKIRSKQKNVFKHIKAMRPLYLSHWLSSNSHFNIAYPR